MSTTALDTVPERTPVAHGELRLLAIDFTNQLGNGESLTTPTTAVVTRIDTNTVKPNVIVNNSLSINGTAVEFIVNGEQFDVGRAYRVVVICQRNSGSTVAAGLVMDCPF